MSLAISNVVASSKTLLFRHRHFYIVQTQSENTLFLAFVNFFLLCATSIVITVAYSIVQNEHKKLHYFTRSRIKNKNS